MPTFEQRHPSRGKKKRPPARAPVVVRKVPTPAPASQGHPSRGAPTSQGAKTVRKLEHKAAVRKKRVARRTGKSTFKAPVGRKLAVGRLLRAAHKSERQYAHELAKTKVDKDFKLLGVNLEAEAEGRGKIAKLGRKVGTSLIAQNQAGLQGSSIVDKVIPRKIQNAATRDVFDLPAQSIASGYNVGAGAYEAAKGRPERLKGIKKQFVEHDPVVSLVTGHPKKALKEAAQHPVVTGLEVTGVGRGLSIGAGATARAGALGGSAKKAASFKGRDRVVPGTNRVERGFYSRGVVGKAAQVKKDKVQSKRAAKEYRKAEEAEKREAYGPAQEHRKRAAKLDPRVAEMGGAYSVVRKHGNRFEQVAEGIRRKHRTEALKEGKGFTPGDVLVGQRIVQPTRESIRRYRDDLKALAEQEPRMLSKAELIANRNTREHLDEMLKEPDSQKFAEQAAKYVVPVQKRQQRLVEQEVLAPERERMAKQVGYVVREMGAKFDETPQKTAAQLRSEALQAEEHKAMIEVKKAGRAVSNKRVIAARQEGSAGVFSRQFDARLKRKTPRELAKAHESRLDFKPNSYPFKDIHGTRHFESGRGFITVDGKVVTEFETPKDFSRVQGHGVRTHSGMHHDEGVHSDDVANFLIRPDGTIRIHDPGRNYLKAHPNWTDSDILRHIERAMKAKTAMLHNRRPIGPLRKLEREKGKEGLAELQLRRRKEEYAVAKKARQKAFVPKDERKTREFRDPEGNVIRAAEVEAHMEQRGIDPKLSVYVSQAPDPHGAGAYFTAWGESKGIGSKRRSGEAVRKGTFQLHKDVAQENLGKMQGLVDATDNYTRYLSDFGFRNPKNPARLRDFPDRQAAEDYMKNEAFAEGPNNPLSQEWVAVPTRPQFGRTPQSRALLDAATDLDLPFAISEDLAAAFNGEGSGKFVLIHASAAKVQRGHLAALDPTAGGKAWREIVRQFRSTVLTTNPPWMTGNIVEGMLRAGVAGVLPSDVKFIRHIEQRLREIDPDAADRLRAGLGAGHFGTQELQHIYTSAKMFEDSFLEPLARVLGSLRRVSLAVNRKGRATSGARVGVGPKELADVWSTWQRMIYGGNGIMETQIKLAMLGKYARTFLTDENSFTNWHKAVEQAAQGLKGTDEQFAALKWLDDAYGKYEGFSPWGRRLIAQYTPFVAWTMNALKFMTIVIPRDHPVLTSVIAANHQASEEWRNEMGLGRGIDGPLPGWLQGSTPVGDTWRRFQRYTPAGAFGDPFETIGGALLPNISGVWLASKGLDWSGKPIEGYQDPDKVSEGDRLHEAAKSFAGSMLPLFGQYQRSKEKGVAETLNPFAGVKRQPPELSRAFALDQKVNARMEELRDPKKHKLHGKRIDAQNPTREYSRLLDQHNKYNAQIYKYSKGQYGRKPAGESTPAPSGGPSWVEKYGGGGAGSGGGSWVDKYK